MVQVPDEAESFGISEDEPQLLEEEWVEVLVLQFFVVCVCVRACVRACVVAAHSQV